MTGMDPFAREKSQGACFFGKDFLPEPIDETTEEFGYELVRFAHATLFQALPHGYSIGMDKSYLMDKKLHEKQTVVYNSMIQCVFQFRNLWKKWLNIEQQRAQLRKK